MRFLTFLAAFVALLVLAGCTSAPIMNVDNAAVASPSGTAPTQQQVRGAIIAAGGALGWQMKDEGPNMVVGTLMLRTHTAVVEIAYSAATYSIRYRSSINLNEAEGKIHKNYNGWVQNLTHGIGSQLAKL